MKQLGVGFVLLIIAIIVSGSVWHSELYQFKTNIQKYTALNITQNTGIKKNLLIMIEGVSDYLPSYPIINEQQITTVFEQSFGKVQNAVGNKKLVTNVIELENTIKKARSGDVIVLADGEYRLENKALRLGTVNYFDNSSLPVVITSQNFKKAHILVDTSVGIEIVDRNWIVSNLVFKGICDRDFNCEHAIHIAGDADNIQVLGNDFVNFNSAIKSNGLMTKGGSNRAFPDNVIISGNRFYNEWTRDARRPITPIDVVGGENWVVIDNFIADFSKLRKGKMGYAYGAYLKGNSENGLFESNFVACMWKVPHYSALDLRIGLSFGGGGTGDKFCSGGVCNQEHKAGVMTKNTIVNCSQGPSVYINKSEHIDIQNNTFIGSTGIELFNSKNIMINSNILNGKITKNDRESSFEESLNKYTKKQISF